MANEFSRKETVADYQVYAGREGSQIDFSKEAEKIATGRKNDCVGFFFGCASNHRDETFLFLSKFHIFCLQRNYGGTK
jgi:hypothetical protein